MRITKPNIMFMLLVAFAVATFSVDATINVTATMQTVWDLIDNVVDNTDSIVGLFVIGVILMVMASVGVFIRKTLNDKLNHNNK